jgi:hypothetical protein
VYSLVFNGVKKKKMTTNEKNKEDEKEDEKKTRRREIDSKPELKSCRYYRPICLGIFLVRDNYAESNVS